MMPTEPRVGVVILNWNSARDTTTCVESLRKSTYANLHVIIIDNGSTDDSLIHVRPLAAQTDSVLIEAGENLGFPGGCNLGARRVLADGADYVFLLNADTEIDASALSRLIDVAESDPNIGVVTPKIFYFDDASMVWYGGAEFDWRYLVGRQVGYGLRDDVRYDVEADVPWATGCAMLISRAAVDAVGLLNEDFFFGTEDLDYSLRITARGYRIRYVPSAKLWHKEAAAAGGRDNPQYVYYQVRNVLLLRRIWASGVAGRLRAIAFSWVWIGRRSLTYAAGGNWRCLVATAYGIADHLRRAYGRREYPLIARRRAPRKTA
ncbi:MAG: glycosyltransferase family 2 protein [Gemmatimonadaceae bacterium]|nr:glycosyltransferase family 2 protein [Gemmatimonadaceae bacterium]